MLTRRMFTGALAAAAMSPMVSEARRQDSSEPQALFVGQGRYLPYLQLLRRNDRTGGQQLAQLLAMVGEPRGALSAWEEAMEAARRGSSPPPAAPDLSAARAEDAINAIVRASRDRRVVILNEAHHISGCRVFARDVARALKAVGFDTFAAETFIDDTSGAPFRVRTFRAGDTLDPGMGYYTRDPTFAETVRQVSAFGYRLVDYEQRTRQEYPGPATGIARREKAEAENLAAYMWENPGARILVYCGFSHAAERPVGPEEWMASRLRVLTGVDPLTIEQSQNWPGSTAERDSARVSAVLNRFRPSAPTSVTVNGRPLLASQYDGCMDVAVYHPRLEEVDARPGWWARDPARRRTPVRLPRAAAAELLLQAQPSGEVEVAVPSDQILLQAGATGGVLYLRPGRYRIRMETLDGHTTLPPLTVPA